MTRKQKAAKAKEKASKANDNSNSNKGKEKANANMEVLKDCIICKNLQNPPSDIKHLFQDCPTLKRMKDLGPALESAKGGRATESNAESSKAGSTRNRVHYRDA